MSEVVKLYTRDEIERLLDAMIVEVRREAPRTRRAKPSPPLRSDE